MIHDDTTARRPLRPFELIRTWKIPVGQPHATAGLVLRRVASLAIAITERGPRRISRQTGYRFREASALPYDVLQYSERAQTGVGGAVGKNGNRRSSKSVPTISSTVFPSWTAAQVANCNCAVCSHA